MRRVLLVGEAPAPDPSKRHLQAALACAAIGERPSRAAYRRALRTPGVGPFALECLHENLLDYWPGYSGRGSAFPALAARAATVDFWSRFGDPRFDRVQVVLFAGKRVAAAFGHRLEYLQLVAGPRRRYSGATFRLGTVPHPSGANAWWNDAENRALFAEFALEVVKGLR